MKKSKKIEKQAKIADVQRIKAKSKKKKKILIRFNMNNYVIINFYKSNLFINLQEVHGTSRYWTSSGLMGYKGRKKKSYDGSLGHAIKFLRKLTFLGDFKPFIVWKGVPRRNVRTIIKALRYVKKKFSKLTWRGTIAYLFTPFNGCRRQKLKRR